MIENMSYGCNIRESDIMDLEEEENPEQNKR
jgi:hypothetical protein